MMLTEEQIDILLIALDYYVESGFSNEDKSEIAHLVDALLDSQDTEELIDWDDVSFDDVENYLQDNLTDDPVK